MIASGRVLVVDIDGTICEIKSHEQEYSEVAPEPHMLERLRKLHSEGWRIILSTSRGMRSSDGNVGQITKTVGPTLLHWLAEHDVPFDELCLGKPWPGKAGFYIDDRAVRPREFLSLSFHELEQLVERILRADVNLCTLIVIVQYDLG